MDERIDHLLEKMGPSSWGAECSAADFDSKPFALLSPGEQSLVLLLRALVGKPPLLILEEPFAGMDSRMIAVVRDYLRTDVDPEQAVVFVTHWEEEVPWDTNVTRRIRLQDGVATLS